MLLIVRRIALGLLLLVASLFLIIAFQLIRHSSSVELDPPPPDSLRVATYNVHYISLYRKEGNWGTDHWNERKQSLDRVFKYLKADVVAFQEMESFGGSDDDSVNLVRSWLLSNNPQYSAAAIGPWKNFPSTQPVFYRKDKIELVSQGWFFFSEMPDKIYSRTFNGSYPAFASWVEFLDKTTRRNFKVVNVHLDFSSRKNRTRSVDLTVQRIKPWIESGEIVLLAGDLNARHGSGLHKKLNSVGLEFVPVKGSTYHFNRGINLFGAIDHIAYTPGIELIGRPVVVRTKAGKVWATDHYPVVADFKF